jgi:hypothetical protein
MKWVFQNDLIGRLRGDSQFPFGAFLFIFSKELFIEISKFKTSLEQKGGLP